MSSSRMEKRITVFVNGIYIGTFVEQPFESFYVAS